MKALSCLAVILFIAFAGESYAAITAKDLGTLGGNESEALDINTAGTAVGWSEAANGDARAFVWTQAGGMKALPMLAGGTKSAAFHVNNSGQIVGVSNNGNGALRIVMWEKANGVYAIRSTGIVAGYMADPLNSNHQDIQSYKDLASINNYGEVAAWQDTPEVYYWKRFIVKMNLMVAKSTAGTGGGLDPIFINDFGTITTSSGPNWCNYLKPLDTNNDGKGDKWVSSDPDGTNSLVKDWGGGSWFSISSGVNTFGMTAIGESGIENSDAYLFDTNSPDPQGMQGGQKLSIPSWAIGAWPESISDSGAAAGDFDVGNYYNGPVSPRAGMWDNGTPFPFTSTVESSAHSVGNFRQAVGWLKTSGNMQAMFGDKRLLLVNMGTLGGANSEAFKVNDAEQAAGWAEISNGNRHAAMWTIDEPFVVDINIKPADPTNTVSLSKNVLVNVAMYSQYKLSATKVAPSSVRFAGAAPVSYADWDMNGDGRVDRVYRFAVKNTSLTTGSTSAQLTGTMVSGRKIWGSDSVKVVR